MKKLGFSFCFLIKSRKKADGLTSSYPHFFTFDYIMGISALGLFSMRKK